MKHMQRFSPPLRGRRGEIPRTGTTAAIIVAAIVFGALPASAQGADVAYVEGVKGSVTATVQGTAAAIDVLDLLSDQTRVELAARSELQLCHHGLRKLVTLKGPLSATVSSAGVTAANGNAIAPSAHACAAPVISTFQGGIVSRSVGGGTNTKVSLQPTIKVIGGNKAIRRITLWDGNQQKQLATFERGVARPKLDDGRSYLVLVQREDGSELKMLLEASAGTKTGPVILLAR
jgi:hypothetical protein